MKKIWGVIFIFILVMWVVVCNPISANTTETSLTSGAPSCNTINLPSESVISNINSDNKADVVKDYDSHPTLAHNQLPAKTTPTASKKSSVNSMNRVISLFNKYVTTTFPKTGIPGAAVIVVQNGQVKYLKCLGVKDLKTKAPVDPHTLFQIGSCTKAFTSAIIAKLVDRGLMQWDDKVQKYYPNTNQFLLPSKTDTQQVTIRDLLCHRTGLAAYSGDDLWLSFDYKYPEVLYKMRFLKPTAKFRSTMQYNNIMYALAGECSAKVSRTKWQELTKKILLKPLKMNTATVTYQDFLKSSNRVHTYANYQGHYVEFTKDISVANGAGLLASSISELAHWLNFQLDNGKFQGRQIVSSQSLQETRKPQIIMKDATGKKAGYYGFGWMLITSGINQGIIMHTGDAVPSKTLIAFHPAQKWGIAVVSNEGNYGSNFNKAVLSAFNQLYNTGKISTDTWPGAKKGTDESINHTLQLKHEKPQPPLTPAQKLTKYTGIYSSNFYGKIVINYTRNRLRMIQGNNKKALNLVHWNGNSFRVDGPITDTCAYTSVDFINMKNGKAQMVNIIAFDKLGVKGTFQRIKYKKILKT